MTDFLDRLSARARGEMPSLRPLVESVYETTARVSVPSDEDDARTVEDDEQVTSSPGVPRVPVAESASPSPEKPSRFVEPPESRSVLVAQPQPATDPAVGLLAADTKPAEHSQNKTLVTSGIEPEAAPLFAPVRP